LNRFVLTAAEMRLAEERAIAAGTPVETLMERAGLGVAEAAWRFAGPLPTLVLCGPGNNGGDGYVAAHYLRQRGVEVRVAALGEPKAGAAAAARAAWDGPVQALDEAEPAAVLIDALFGTGLTRGLDEQVAGRLNALGEAARVRVAVDLPSGVHTDTGAVLSPVPVFDLTVTFATLKPVHLLQPAASHCGRVVVADIGIKAEPGLTELGRPMLPPPGPEDHKYSRGYVAVLAGEMRGAAALAAEAAAHSGAGYVRLIADKPLCVSHAIVQSRDPAVLSQDERIGCGVVGPGLGRGEEARALLDLALGSGRPLVIDGDGLFCLGEWPSLEVHILTPHEGEFRRLFPGLDQPSKVQRAREAARRSGAVIVYKGADTVIAAPDGRAAIGAGASPWLSTAGTGDVLAGAIGAMRARGLPAFEAAKAGVWLHTQAAARAGKAFVADDLARHLSDAL
jgi:hydroxyethylthiazole kinase-like uncharacterized protein yjeF